MNWFVDPWSYGFMCDALIGGLAAATSCAPLGVYVVFRRMAFAGEAMSHTTLPGLVVAQSQGWSLAVGALASNLLTALGIGAVAAGPSHRRGIRDDAAIGVVFTGTFALGVLLAYLLGSSRDLTHLILGNILAVTPGALAYMIASALVILAVLVAIHKELELTSYDATYADLIGIGSARVRFLVLVLVALAVVSGVQAVGVILTSALLVTPAATAALFTRRLVPMMLLATVFAWATIAIGLMVAFHADLPAGATIVATAALGFVGAWASRRLQH